jgi:hypothetical protein
MLAGRRLTLPARLEDPAQSVQEIDARNAPWSPASAKSSSGFTAS